MGNLSNTAQDILPEFQKFLLERKLVPEKNAPFFAYWVSRFFDFARNRDIPSTEYHEAAVLEFLDALRSDKRILEWQPRQADDAIRLYYLHFLGKAGTKVSGGITITNISEAINEMRRLIRLRHYSYNTERTYLQWVEKFLSYALESRKNIADITSEDFKNFLSHLAIKQRVSASTQNQAFNSILFLFRSIFGKDTADLGDTIRAKRGQKLPVVLSIDEVKALFQHLFGTSLLIAQMLYGAGLRLMELARLRVKDIDFNANLLFVRSGKGDKDRSTILPDTSPYERYQYQRGAGTPWTQKC